MREGDRNEKTVLTIQPFNKARTALKCTPVPKSTDENIST
jgi:hypothetical protein